MKLFTFFKSQMNQTQLRNTLTTISLIIVYQALWYAASIFEYKPGVSLWYAPAGLTVAILILWKKDGFLKAWLCVACVSVITQFGDHSMVTLLLISISAALAHTVPYWLSINLFRKVKTILQNKPEGPLILPIAFCALLLLGSFWAALLGLLSEVTLAGMSLTIAQNIWLGWWIGDYVGVVVLSPFFIFLGCQYIHKFIVPEDIFLLHYSQSKSCLPKGKGQTIAWLFIIFSPAVIAIARAQLDARIPEIIAYIILLLPIAMLSTRATWGILVSAVAISSISIVFTVTYFGIIGQAIAYQATLIATAVTSIYFYDLVQNFELKAQKLLETERSLSTASRLLTLNEIGANIAHELRTPLQTALSSSQRVRRRLDKLDDDWSIELNELNNTKDAIDQISNTIESVRDLIKIPNPKELVCSVNDTLMIVYNLIKSTANQQAVKIDIPRVKAQYLARMDSSELIQILMNLLTNGIRSVAKSSVKEVTISFNQVDDTTMFLEITDSGKGIARSNMNNLFKLGYPRSNEGLGLGLWVSKSIALRRNGNLEYIHNDDNWCFRLTLNRIECQK